LNKRLRAQLTSGVMPGVSGGETPTVPEGLDRWGNSAQVNKGRLRLGHLLCLLLRDPHLTFSCTAIPHLLGGHTGAYQPGDTRRGLSSLRGWAPVARTRAAEEEGYRCEGNRRGLSSRVA
jgi:hypothetical protein